MLVLGISGGLDPVYANRDFLFPYGTCHDSAAVLVDDGRVVAAIEEERLNRIKHTSKGAVSAIRFCLESYGVSLSDVARLAVYTEEKGTSREVRMAHYRRPHEGAVLDLRGIIHQMLERELGEDIADEKLLFVPHHLAHAESAYAQSGFDRSLVMTIDGVGDAASGMLLNAEDGRMDVLHVLPVHKSLGIFYLDVIRFLGYDQFEEYKVMGLAPYGDPSKFRPLFKKFYDLLPGGDYFINPDFPDLLCRAGRRRKPSDPLNQSHTDLAATLQEALEEIVFHVLRHYRKRSGQRRLCMAGGVAHNCSLNGKILYSGMFDEVFVQPAAHDAGCAVGAALHALRQEGEAAAESLRPRAQLEHVYWGTEVGDDETISRALSHWGTFLGVERDARICERAATLLAEGAVIGWVQGRSEFGPRALGNRSIVADPRPAANKDLINSMVKKREAFRPFAPSVLEEYTAEYFDLPREGLRSPFMTFVVRVREEKRDVLGATTHVDGTARIQTVSKQTNPRYWELIDEFRKQTGVPVLLNTSFNNNAEPIVDSVEDAVVCFLTTRLNYLVVGDFLVEKKSVDERAYLELAPSLPLYSRLMRTRGYVSRDELADVYELSNSYQNRYAARISAEMFETLQAADGSRTLGELLRDNRIEDDAQVAAIVAELIELWSKRVVALHPPGVQSNPYVSPGRTAAAEESAENAVAHASL
jgi:carbamoyltransferase